MGRPSPDEALAGSQLTDHGSPSWYAERPMRYLFWLLKFALFALILSFAVKNAEIVSVRYYLGQEWQAPLVLVLLVFFCVGAAVGILASLAQLFRQRREIVALKRELRDRGPAGGETAPANPPDVA